MQLKMKFFGMNQFVLTLALILSASFSFAQSNPDAILGKWLTGSKKGHVEIYKQSGKYYGKIVWLKEPLNDAGKPKVDENNPEESLQSKPLVGLVNLKDFEWDADDEEYTEGTIYDPENGSTYDCYMVLEDNDNLKVRGYIGFSLIGRTDMWTRVK